MIFRRFLVRSTALTALAAGVWLAPDALAQKGQTMEPATQWTVSQVEAAQAAGPAYCAVARRFKTDKIMTFAQNQNGEMSLALDFQRPNFNTKNNYEIVLDPGAGQQRSYQLSPASNRVFVVRMGRDDAFIEALKKTGMLRADIGDQAYNFNLEDIDSGVMKLTSCIAALSSSAVAVADAPSTPSDKADIESLRAEMNALKNQNSKISGMMDRAPAMEKPEETKTAPAPLSQAPLAPANAPPIPVAPPPQIIPVPAAVDTGLAKRIETLQAENDALRSALGNVPPMEMQANASADGASVKALRAENDRLKTALMDQTNSSSDSGVKSMMAQMQGLRQANKKLQEDLKVQKAQADQGAQKKIESLQAENKELQDSLIKAQAEQASLGNLAADLASTKKENAELRAQVQGAEAKLAGQASMADETLQALQAQIAVLENQIKDKDAKLQDMAALADEMRALKSSSADLAKQVESNGAREQQVAFLEKKVAEYENENLALKRSIADLSRGQGDLLGLRKDIETERARNQDLMATIETLQGTIRSLERAQISTAAGEGAPEETAAVKQMARDVAPSPVAATASEDEGGPAMPAGLSEAQKQEEMLSENLRTGETLPVVQTGDALQVQKSEDPFAAIKVEEEFSGFAVDDSGKMSEGIRSRAESAAIDKEDLMGQSPAPAAVSAQGFYSPAFSIASLLTQAGITPVQPVVVVPGASNARQVAYQWQADSVHGSGEQEILSSAQDFDAQVQRYLEKTQTRCAGDFAIIPGDTADVGNVRVDGYDVACVGRGVNSSASLLFVGKEGTFAAIAHEAPTDKLQAAMDMRDKLMKSLRGS